MKGKGSSEKKNQKTKEKRSQERNKKAEEALKGSENPFRKLENNRLKEKLQEIVEALFGEKSNGTWMPAGLLPAVQEKLGLRLVIWHVTREEVPQWFLRRNSKRICISCAVYRCRTR